MPGFAHGSLLSLPATGKGIKCSFYGMAAVEKKPTLGCFALLNSPQGPMHPMGSDADGDGGRSSFPGDWTQQGCPRPRTPPSSHAPLIVGDKFLQLLGQRVAFAISRTTEFQFWCLKVGC